MDHRELHLITPRGLINKLRGFRRNQDEQVKNSWEQIRITCWRLLSPYYEKGKDYKPWDVLPLPWDNEVTEKPEVDPKQEAERRKKLWDDFDKANQ